MRAVALAVDAGDGGQLSLAISGRVALAPAPLLLVMADRVERCNLVDVTVLSDNSEVTVSARLDQTSLHASWGATRVGAEHVWEFSLTLRNDGDAPVSVTRMDPLSVILDGTWQTLAFRSTWCEEGQPQRGTTATPRRFESRSGRSSHGYSPWLGLGQGDRGLVISPAWSGNWHIDILRGGHVNAGISQWQFEVVLEPGQSVTAPSVVLAAGSSTDDAARALTRAVGAAWIPRSAASDRLDVTWNPWAPYEDVEIDESVVRANCEIGGRIGVDTAVVDAGWFGPADPDSFWYFLRGDWDSVNTARFPSGLGALGEGTRASGVRPGIWIEAESVGRHSKLRSERPDLLALAVDGRRHDPSYYLTPESVDPDDTTFLGYVCLGSPAGREFVAASLDGAVASMGAEHIKLDFNVDPDAGCTRTDHGHGAGDGLLRHYEGLYAVLDEFRERHPEVVLEHCASGGMRVDLGMARHAHCFFLSDPDYTEHSLQVLWATGKMLPPAAMLHWSWSQTRGFLTEANLDFDSLTDDEFATTVRGALLHRPGLSLRLPDLPLRHLDTLRSALDTYRRDIRDLVCRGELIALTDQPQRRGAGERFPAFQLTDGVRSVVIAFRLDPQGAEKETPSIIPVGLDPASEYRLIEPDVSPAARPFTAGTPLPAVNGPGRFASRLFVIEPTTLRHVRYP
jgi:alpha-galactosidase